MVGVEFSIFDKIVHIDQKLFDKCIIIDTCEEHFRIETEVVHIFIFLLLKINFEVVISEFFDFFINVV